MWHVITTSQAKTKHWKTVVLAKIRCQIYIVFDLMLYPVANNE